MEAARIRVAAHLEVILRATAIFVSDVAFANIACKYDDFLWRMKNACLTMTHDAPYRSSRDAASLFPSRILHVAAQCCSALPAPYDPRLLLVRSSAARIPWANFCASSIAQKCMKNRCGESSIM